MADDGEKFFPIPRQKIAAWCADAVELKTLQAFERDVGDSPIEKIFYAALDAVRRHGDNRLDGLSCAPRGEESKLWGVEAWSCMYVEWQRPILDRRVDFVIRLRDHVNNKWISMIVECDGHDFHEKTKEQAIRDRSFDRRAQDAGYTIFRFTGSEIWNKPCECAESVIQWIESAYFDLQMDQLNQTPTDRRK